jgi:hypothetical protein
LLYKSQRCTNIYLSYNITRVIFATLIHHALHQRSFGIEQPTFSSINQRQIIFIDPNYHRRSQIENEFIFYILPTLQEGSSSQASKKQAIHTSCRNGDTFMHETLTSHEAMCRRRFHMERYIFEALAQRLCESNLLTDSRYVSVEEHLLSIFLYAMSKNTSNRTSQDQFQHS